MYQTDIQVIVVVLAELWGHQYKVDCDVCFPQEQSMLQCHCLGGEKQSTCTPEKSADLHWLVLAVASMHQLLVIFVSLLIALLNPPETNCGGCGINASNAKVDCYFCFSWENVTSNANSHFLKMKPTPQGKQCIGPEPQLWWLWHQCNSWLLFLFSSLF